MNLFWIPLLLAIEGFFSGSEMALISADRLSLRAKANRGSRRSKIAYELATHPEKVLSCTLFITCACVVLISVIISNSFESELFSVILASTLIVIFGELIPKSIFKKHSNSLAPYTSYPITIVYYLFYPVTKLLTLYTFHLSQMLRPFQELSGARSITVRDELLLLLNHHPQDTEISSSEQNLIKRIIDFRSTLAKHILIPLIRVEAIEQESTVRSALEKFQQHRHSRMPVYSKRIDHIIGVLEVDDLYEVQNLDTSIRTYVMPVEYVAETQSLESVLTEMREQNSQLMVVVDEYGGASGILTFEDVIEEIVGEISDEYDEQRSEWIELGGESWMIQARTQVAKLNEAFQTEIPEGDYETLGGLLIQHFGRIPQSGEEVLLETPTVKVRFMIRRASERQLQTILMEILQRKSLT